MKKQDTYKIIKATQGWRLERNGKPVAYYGEYGDQGVYYKDEVAYENGKGVCYIAEFEFECADKEYGELFDFQAKKTATQNGLDNNPYIAYPNKELTTRNTIKALAKELYKAYQEVGESAKLKDIMDDLFWTPDWQCVETYASEWGEGI